MLKVKNKNDFPEVTLMAQVMGHGCDLLDEGGQDYRFT